MTNFKVKPGRNKRYLKRISERPCCLTGDRATDWMGVDPHHEERPGHSGTATKACDSRAVPIRHDLHVKMETPGHSRASVFAEYGIDPEEVIKEMRLLWVEEGNLAFWE